MLSIKCPNCGGTVQFDEQHIATFCSFCGSHLPGMEEYTKKAGELEIQIKQHEMEMKRLKVKERNQKLENLSDFIAMLPILLVIIFLLYLFIKIFNH